MPGHATRFHHLLPNWLLPDGIGKHKSSCALETIHTWTCENNIAYLHFRVTPNKFNACCLERNWVIQLDKQMPRVTWGDVDRAE